MEFACGPRLPHYTLLPGDAGLEGLCFKAIGYSFLDEIFRNNLLIFLKVSDSLQPKKVGIKNYFFNSRRRIMSADNPKDMTKDKIVPIIRDILHEQLSKGVIVVSPQTGLVFGPSGAGTSWGRSTPISWAQAGPPWVNSAEIDKPWDEWDKLFDFGGQLTTNLLAELQQIGARIILGSAEESRWRIAVHQDKVKEVKRILRENQARFIKPVASGSSI
jgi:hypothetical protein